MLLGAREKLCEKADFFGVFCRKSQWFHEKVHPSIAFLYFFIKMQLSNAFFRFYNTKKATLPC